MKVFRILGRNVRDAFKSVFRNFSLSIASITCTIITLLLVAITAIVGYNLNSFAKDLESGLMIHVRVQNDATKEEIDLLRSKIEAIDSVEEINYVSNEDIKKEESEKSEEIKNIMDLWTPETNPLDHEFRIKVDSINNMKEVSSTISSFAKVNGASYGENAVDKLIPIFGYVQKVTIVIVIALIIVTVFLISNTIKLTIFSRRNEIEIMRLVGTSNTVIRLPFLFEGFFLGVAGAIVPILITIYGYIFAYDKFAGYKFLNLFELVKPTPFVFQLSLLLLAIGIVVGMFGSYHAARKYLKI